MSLIVGLAHRGKVWIGADSASVSDDFSMAAQEPKVFRKDGWLVAVGGSWRATELIRYAVRFPKLPEVKDAHRVITLELIRDIIGEFESRGFELEVDLDNDLDELGDFHILLGVHGALYHLHHWQAQRVALYGSGAAGDIAIGFLEATRTGEPTTRIKQAMGVAARYYPAQVRRKFTVLHT